MIISLHDYMATPLHRRVDFRDDVLRKLLLLRAKSFRFTYGMEALVIPNASSRVHDQVDVVVVVILTNTLAKPIMRHMHKSKVAFEMVAVDFFAIGGVPQVHDFRDARTRTVDVHSSFVVGNFPVYEFDQFG